MRKMVNTDLVALEEKASKTDVKKKAKKSKKADDKVNEEIMENK